MAQQKRIQLGTMRLQVRSLASLRELRISRCCELWCSRKCGSDLALLWHWCRPAATAPIRPLAWEPPYAMGMALKRQKTKRKRNKSSKIILKYLGGKRQADEYHVMSHYFPGKNNSIHTPKAMTPSKTAKAASALLEMESLETEGGHLPLTLQPCLVVPVPKQTRGPGGSGGKWPGLALWVGGHGGSPLGVSFSRENSGMFWEPFQEAQSRPGPLKPCNDSPTPCNGSFLLEVPGVVSMSCLEPWQLKLPGLWKGKNPDSENFKSFC